MALGQCGEVEQHAALVGRVGAAGHQAGFGETVGQFGGAVVTDAQPLSQRADCGRAARWQSFELQQCLVLARREAGGARLTLAEIQEAADEIAEFRQRLVIRLGRAGFRGGRLLRRCGVLASHGGALQLAVYIS
ncbi:MAG: hypothetical protein BGP12_00985 [Rhodospirillales bacterium 70-18]|nr:MAG: hypothetical protein BGP12_00985 [Rhodospirillales bacterium 70-18]